MTSATRDAGSFRDPSGYVFRDGERVIRAVMPSADEKFRQVYDSGVLTELADAGLMIGCKRLDADEAELARYQGARGETAAALYEHPAVPLLSYPYEWVFSQLKDAALAHLKLQIMALDRGYDLSDATAYNMQFMGGKPVHIDVMSIQPYEDGAHWAGYNQFCRQFLLPLLLEAWGGVNYQTLYRGNIAGITFEDALAIIPRRKLLTSMTGMLHVYMHGRAVMSKSSEASAGEEAGKRLPKDRYKAILVQLSDFIKGLETRQRNDSYWATYASVNSYSDEMRQTKLDFVEAWAREAKPGTVWDIGGNSGDFSQAAIRGGARDAVVLDGDLDSLEFAYRKRTKAGERLFPLLANLVDPTPALGWRLQERKSLMERLNADGIIALAIIHHMCISGNIPLKDAVGWLLELAPGGIIEFVPKTDPMVRQLLAVREDIFDDYTEETFRSIIEADRKVLAEHRFDANGRLLLAYGPR